MPSAIGPGTTLRRPRALKISVAMIVMPVAIAMGTRLFDEFHVPNWTGNRVSSVNHLSCATIMDQEATTYLVASQKQRKTTCRVLSAEQRLAAGGLFGAREPAQGVRNV